MKKVFAVAVLLPALVLAGCAPQEGPSELRPATLKGHREVRLVDGVPAPLILGGEHALSLCYGAHSLPEGARIHVAFDGMADAQGPRPAADRSESAVCFRGDPPAAWRRGVLEQVPTTPDGMLPVRICGRLEDLAGRGKSRDAGCVDAYFRGAAAYEEMLAKRSEVLRSAWDEPLHRSLPRLDGLARDLRRAGFPQLAVNLDLTALHFLVRDSSEASLAAARARLDGLPEWLGLPFTEQLAANVLYQKARFLRRSLGRRAEAWEALEQSEELLRRVALPRLSTAHAMAQMVAAAGAVEEARARLTTALDQCAPRTPGGPSRCSRVLEADARGTLAWMILTDGGVGESELRLAENYLRSALAVSDGRDPLEVINRRLDLAYLQLRLGEDPRPTLRRATAELDATAETDGARKAAGTADAGRRHRRLAAWRTLILGLAAVRDGRATEAIEHCGSLLADEELAANDLAVTAWAYGCVGRGERARGRLHEAAEAFSRALDRHELILGWQRSRRLPLGLDQRAEDFARAARLAVERGRPAEAWDLLLRLDRLSIHESARRRCRQEASTPEDRAEWRRLDREVAEIHETLESFDGPAPLDRRRARERLARDVKERLRELWRHWPGCEAPPPSSDRGLAYRAVALDDEILLLHRTTDGAVLAARRTPLPRKELRQILDRLEAMAPDGSTFSDDEDAWRKTAAPLTEALVPEKPWPELLTYALHGPLQRVPLPALPLIGDEEQAPWLGGRAKIALQPAGAVARTRDSEKAAGEPLFVVDPSRNLPGASAQATDYARLFPAAEILRGAAARHDRVTARMPFAEWIHFDTHGTFDAVLPEMSSLVLADRPLPWLELAGSRPRARFVNLSGCETGRWPITADSGTYGLSGLFTRLGTPWAVGSRVDLPDDVAAEFNRTFYRAVHGGRDVPEAFRAGIERLATTFPVPRWSGLLLLRAAPSEPRFGPREKKVVTPGGQNFVPSTPSQERPESPPFHRGRNPFGSIP